MEFDIWRSVGGAMIPLVIGAIVLYSMRRLWIGATTAALCCLILNTAPIGVRITSALMCVAVLGVAWKLTPSRLKPQP